MILNIKNISNFYLMDIVPLPNIYITLLGEPIIATLVIQGKVSVFLE